MFNKKGDSIGYNKMRTKNKLLKVKLSNIEYKS